MHKTFLIIFFVFINMVGDIKLSYSFFCHNEYYFFHEIEDEGEEEPCDCGTMAPGECAPCPDEDEESTESGE